MCYSCMQQGKCKIALAKFGPHLRYFSARYMYFQVLVAGSKLFSRLGLHTHSFTVDEGARAVGLFRNSREISPGFLIATPAVLVHCSHGIMVSIVVAATLNTVDCMMVWRAYWVLS